MIIDSPFPPLPPPPEVNVYNVIWNSPATTSIPDYTAFLDGDTGRSFTRAAFKERTLDLATAMAAPVSLL